MSSFVDSMMLTTYGQEMYEELMQEDFDSSDSSEIVNSVAHLMHYHFQHMYYKVYEPEKLDANVVSDLCYNKDLVLSNPADSFLEGWSLFNGSSRYQCRHDANQLSELPVLESVIPEPPLEVFNLDPFDNQNITSPFATFDRIEMYLPSAGNDELLPFISKNPPSNARSVRLNNTRIWFVTNSMIRKLEKKANQNAFYFSSAVILENPNTDHTDRLPYLKIIAIDDSGNSIDEICYTANPNDLRMGNTNTNLTDPILNDRPENLTYKDWSCDSLDLSSVAVGDSITIKFVAASCGKGAHFGYAYISDICEDCENFASIKLDSNQWDCPNTSFDVCGTFSLDTNDFILDSITLDINIENTTIASLTNPSISNDTFCFTINTALLETLAGGRYDFYSTMHFKDSIGGTIRTLRSLSTIKNTIADKNNDLILDSCSSCPEDTLTLNVSQIFCLTGNDYVNNTYQFEGSLLFNNLPNGFEYCNELPVFPGNSVEITNSSYWNDILQLEGIISIPSTQGLPVNPSNGRPYLEGQVLICKQDSNSVDSCYIPVHLELASSQVTMCENQSGIMCNNFKPNIFGPYGSEGSMGVSFSLVFPYGYKIIGENDTCEVTQWNYEIYGYPHCGGGLGGGGLNPLGELITSGTITKQQNELVASLLAYVPIESYHTTLNTKFWNNCGDTCEISTPIPGSRGGESGGLKVYPNPTDGQISIELEAFDQQLDIYTIQGNQIFTQQIEQKSSILNLHLQYLESGTYMFIVHGSDGSTRMGLVRVE